jgi:hypothetical protein
MSDYSQKDYWQSVRTVAGEAASLLIEGDADDLHDAALKSLDGTDWTIYYARMLQVMNYTDNDDALWVYYGPEGLGKPESWGDVLEKVAWSAMLADVNDYLWRNHNEDGTPKDTPVNRSVGVFPGKEEE